MAQERAQSGSRKLDTAENEAEAVETGEKTSRLSFIERRKAAAAESAYSPDAPRKRGSLSERLQARKSSDGKSETTPEPDFGSEPKFGMSSSSSSKTDSIAKTPEPAEVEKPAARTVTFDPPSPARSEPASAPRSFESASSPRRLEMSATPRTFDAKAFETAAPQTEAMAKAEPAPEPESDDPSAFRRRPAGPAPRRLATPANDDLPSIGGLIFALQQKPSRTPFLIALVASLVWFVIGGLFAYGLMSSDTNPGGMLSSPTTLTSAMAIIVPIAIFWFLALLIWRAQELRLMASAMTEVAVRLAEPDKLAEQSVASLGQVIRRQVAAMNDGISRAIGRASELEALVHNEVAALERSYNDNETRVRGLISELASEREALANNSERVSAALEGVGARVSKDITAATNEIDRSLADRGLKLTELLVARSNEAASEVYRAQETIATNVPRLMQQLGKEQAGLNKLVEDAVSNLAALENAVGSRTQAFHETMQTSSVAFANSLSDHTNAFDQVMRAHSEGFTSRLAERIQALEGLVTHGTSMIDQTLESRTDALSAQIDRGAQTLVKTLEDGTEVFAVAADTSVTGLEGALKKRTDAFTTAINQGGVAIDKAMAERTGAFANVINRSADALDQTIAERTSAFASTINKGTEALDHTMAERTGAFAGALDQTTQALDKAMAERTGAFANVLDEKTQVLDKAMAERTGAFANAIDEKTHVLDKAMAERTGAFANAINHTTEALDKTIAERTSAFTRAINYNAEALDKSLAERGEGVIKSLQDRLNAIDTTFRHRGEEADKLLARHAQAVEETFGRQTAQLHKVLAENSNVLRQTADVVGNQSGQAVEVLTKQTETLRQVSSGLLEQIHALTQRFENQGQGILTAAKALETSNTKMDSILESRHQAIIGLLHAVTGKARDLDSQMQNYVTVINTAMTEAESRAKQASQLLARDTSTQAQQAVAQIEKMRAEAQAHTARAVDDLKTSFARVIGQIGQQLDQMRGQFDTTSRGMREAAQQTATDLDQLRTEMQTRMDALPEHTAQATAAIRKALAEQISEIEAITPVLTSAASQGLEQNFKPAPSTPEPAPSLASSPAPSAPAPEPEPRFEAPSAPSRSAPEPSPDLDYSALPQFDAYGRPAGGADNDDDLGEVAGNLAEQLSGATSGGTQPRNAPRAGQPAPAPQQQAANAPSGSGGLRLDELARAVDPRTAADVWARYRGGETGVMARQLYTREGQRTYDEVSRRYTRDQEFRGTVDRYMSDFERLLGEAEQADPEGRMLDDYLVSETGRVYLLLAHASGRLR
ncbi:hypothetical protein V6C03_09705 [Methyloligella sp. 2.7D]|uniref:hypothetical protein n=1 Tax=unclassified Methyloligella TaxID=2625955 RepID=UPI00157D591B|nr:hypothetical protein [Methyloligella sp. GL2]QKP77879.1 hypothetical protein HT051_10750 [Methyloligella sp. GL2]